MLISIFDKLIIISHKCQVALFFKKIVMQIQIWLGNEGDVICIQIKS